MPHLTESTLQQTINKDTETMLEELFIFATRLACLYKRGASVHKTFILTMFRRHPVYIPPIEDFDNQRLTHLMNSSCSIHSDGKDTDKADSSIIERMECEVFLGGSCNPTTWRKDIAIPMLKSLNISYYNPQVPQWKPELVDLENEAKETARVLLFVIDDRTRNCASIIETVELAVTRRDSLIVVVHPYKQNQSISDETVSNQEYCELMNGLLVLHYLMEQQSIPIFESIPAAVRYTSKILRNAVNVQNLHGEDEIRSSRISFIQRTTDITNLMEAFKAMDRNNSGVISIPEALMILQSNGMFTNYSASYLYHFASIDDTFMNFEQFFEIATKWSWTLQIDEVNCETNSDWTNTTKPDSEKRDLYIGIVGKDIEWLKSTAIPLVESKNLTYYCSSKNEYITRLLPLELQRMKNSRLIMLVVPHHMRGMTIMALAAYLIGLRAKLVLCVQDLHEGCIISGEKLTERAIKDYNRGRTYLSNMAMRNNVPVFDNVRGALQRSIQIVRNPY